MGWSSGSCDDACRCSSYNACGAGRAIPRGAPHPAANRGISQSQPHVYSLDWNVGPAERELRTSISTAPPSLGGAWTSLSSQAERCRPASLQGESSFSLTRPPCSPLLLWFDPMQRSAQEMGAAASQAGNDLIPSRQLTLHPSFYLCIVET